MPRAVRVEEMSGVDMQLLDASEPLDGTWAGGLEGDGDCGIDVFFDNGSIQIGVHNGAQGALHTLTPEQARWLARLLLKAADSA